MSITPPEELRLIHLHHPNEVVRHRETIQHRDGYVATLWYDIAFLTTEICKFNHRGIYAKQDVVKDVARAILILGNHFFNHVNNDCFSLLIGSLDLFAGSIFALTLLFFFLCIAQDVFVLFSLLFLVISQVFHHIFLQQLVCRQLHQLSSFIFEHRQFFFVLVCSDLELKRHVTRNIGITRFAPHTKRCIWFSARHKHGTFDWNQWPCAKITQRSTLKTDFLPEAMQPQSVNLIRFFMVPSNNVLISPSRR
uniref:Uncharacterized protein n=1 Tax=Globisporangium ultimum (strain ATCC 200006 / CBS 805.95 / DAOM BR144) TaxID=431595 RepID=K3WEQ1_GLOUD